MKTIIFLIPIAILFASCNKTAQEEEEKPRDKVEVRFCNKGVKTNAC